jgi:hypothetical protein
VSLKTIIEDEDLSKVELIYEVPIKGVWTLGDTSKSDIAERESCANCGRQESLRYCGCKLVKYCNTKCL